MENYTHFVTIVAGEEPDRLMEKYDAKKKVEPHIAYRYDCIEKTKKFYLDMLNSMIVSGKEANNFSEIEIEEIKSQIELIETQSDDDFYLDLVERFGLTINEETGDAYTDENPNGRYTYCKVGKNFSVPFLLKDGTEAFQARKKDIDWDKMHMNGCEIYERAWDMVMNGDKPKNDYEKTIFNNMKNRKTYFEFFKTKEKYVISNTAFWGFAFVNDKEWKSMDDTMLSQLEWMEHFYDNFIENLPDDTLITIYECRKD